MKHADFSTSTLGRVMSLEATNSSKVRILDSSFTGEQLVPKGSVGLFYLDSKHISDVFISNTTFSDIHTNGVASCMSIAGGSAKVQIVHSTFRNNVGRCGGIFSMFVNETLVLAIQGSHFQSNKGFWAGGLANCMGKFVNITMLDSKINDSRVIGWGGGVFDVGINSCEKSQDEIRIVNMIFDNTVFEHCSCTLSGGVAAIRSNNGSIIVRDSLFKNISASIGDEGVFHVENSKSSDTSDSLSIEIFNTTFKNIWGVVLLALRVIKLFLDRLIIDSATGGLGIVGKRGMEVNISSSTFNCKIGMISLTAADEPEDRPLRMTISNSFFGCDSELVPQCECVFFDLGLAYVTFTNVTFMNCGTSDSGGAVYLKTAVPSEIIFHSCTFRDNIAWGNVGGAIWMDSLKDELSHPGCSTEDLTTPHRLWHYTRKVQVIDTIFVNNTAKTGGAMVVTNGEYLIKNCTFQDNFASLQGGHIFSASDSTSLLIYATTFLQTRKTRVLKNADNKKISFGVTSFIDTNSQGPLILEDSSLEYKPLGDVKPLVMVSQGGYVRFDNKTCLKCPRGSELDILNFTTKINKSTVQTELQFNCRACPFRTYSLQHGRSVGLKKIGGFHCLPCPFGAECLKNVTAKENYWGYQVPRQNPPALYFTNCPAEYCKHPDQGDPLQYNSCHGNRSGILCGQCKDDYTETLLSPSCRRDDECDDTWLWGVAGLMLLLMATYLVHKPRLKFFIRRQIFWFRKQSFRVQDTEDRNVTLKSHDNGYLKIVFYFYQVANLLLIATSYSTIVESHLLQTVIVFFNALVN